MTAGYARGLHVQLPLQKRRALHPLDWHAFRDFHLGLGLFLRFGHGLRMSLQLPQGVERAQGRARQGPVGWWWAFWGLIFLETPTLASSCNVNARF